MGCVVCGAPSSESPNSCAVCGWAGDGTKAHWDRRPEAIAYEDLSACLHSGAPLLAVTRGRITGSWRGRLSLDPRALITPYGNLGITADKVLFQHISPRTGHALFKGAATAPLESIASIQVADADPFAPGRTVRLVITFASGENLRMRASGRLAEAARDLVEVWEGLTGGRRTDVEREEERCGHCGQVLDRVYQFCPYCGTETE